MLEYTKVGNVLHARFAEPDIFDVFKKPAREFRDVLDEAYEETFGKKRLKLLPSIEE